MKVAESLEALAEALKDPYYQKKRRDATISLVLSIVGCGLAVAIGIALPFIAPLEIVVGIVVGAAMTVAMLGIVAIIKEAFSFPTWRG